MGTGITLRPVTASHADQELIGAMAQSAGVAAGCDPYQTSGEIELWFVVSGENIVGFCGYHSHHVIFQRCRLVLYISKQYRGKQYGRKAHIALNDMLFSERNMVRLEGAVEISNRHMLDILQSIGMRRDGILRQSSYHGGKFHDYVQYSALRHEWDSEREALESKEVT